MAKLLKYIIGLTWLGIVAYFFYKNHSYYQFNFSSIGSWWPLWATPLLMYLGLLAWNWSSDKKFIQFKLTTLRVISLFFAGMLYVGVLTMLLTDPIMYRGPEAVVTYEAQVIFEPNQEQIESAAYFFEHGTSIKDNFGLYEQLPETIKGNFVRLNAMDIILGLSWTYIKVYGSALLLLLFAWIFGSKAHQMLRKKEKDEEQPFEQGALETTLGLGIIITLFFLLAAVGQFNILGTLGGLVILAGILHKHSFKQINALKNWEMSYEIKSSSLLPLLFLLLCLSLGIHIFDNLSVLPRGWDGLNRYIIIAKDLAEGGELLKRGSVYGWEFIMGFFYLFDIKMTLAWTSIPGVLTMILIWLLARRYSSPMGATLALITLILMPMMSFHLSDENKVDVAHWFFGTASIISLLKSLSFKEGFKIKDYSYLWMAGLLAGFAFTTKFTATLLILTLLSSFAFIQGGILGLSSALLVSIGILATMGGLGLGTEFLTSEKNQCNH